MFPIRDVLGNLFMNYPYFGWWLVLCCGIGLYLKSLKQSFKPGRKRGRWGGSRSWFTRSKYPDLDLSEVMAYYSKPAMSWMEQGLYYRLVKALPDHIVLAQVQLSRILGVKEGYDFWTYHNRISQMSADFVVCRKDGSVLAVIELDDSTHEREDRKMADAKKDKALTSAGIRVIRWQVNSLPSVEMISFYFAPDTIDPASHIAPSVSSD